MDTFLNNIDLRNDCSIIVTRCDAKDYLQSVDPALENLTARYYESTLNSSKYTGYTVNITLSEFCSKMKDSCSQAYAILGTVISEDEINSPVKENANYIAGDDPISDQDVIDNLGIAVFKDDKLVGELSGLDSICHVMINNELRECTLSVPNPLENPQYMDLILTSEKSPKCSVSFVDSSPVINVEVYLMAKGLSFDDSVNYDSEDSASQVKQAASEYISEQITNYLYKTSKDYNSDICGFGKYAIKKYLTLDEWFKSDWLGNYKNSSFNVKVNLNLKS